MKKLILAAFVLLAAATGAVLYLSPAAQLTAYQGIEQWRAGLHERSVNVNDLKISYYAVSYTHLTLPTNREV